MIIEADIFAIDFLICLFQPFGLRFMPRLLAAHCRCFIIIGASRLSSRHAFFTPPGLERHALIFHGRRDASLKLHFHAI